MDKREIVLSLGPKKSGKTFRDILSIKLGKKSDNLLKVDPRVKLFSPEGLMVKMEHTLDEPFKVLTTPMGKLKNMGGYVRSIAAFLGTVAETSGAGAGWSPWIDNIKGYQNTAPMSISLKCSFSLGEFGIWSGREEVYKPIINLLALFLPNRVAGINLIGHLRTKSQLLYDFISSLGDIDFRELDLLSNTSNTSGSNSEGTSADSAAVQAGLDLASQVGTVIDNLSTEFGKVIMTSLTAEGSQQIYSVDLGYAGDAFKLQGLQPIGCDVQFSNKEYDDKGYPATGSITMNFLSYKPPTLVGLESDQNSPYISFGLI